MKQPCIIAETDKFHRGNNIPFIKSKNDRKNHRESDKKYKMNYIR